MVRFEQDWYWKYLIGFAQRDPNPPTGLISVNMPRQYVRDNRRTREHLERRGLPAIMMNRLPAHDNTVARRSDGSEADFTSHDLFEPKQR